MLKSKLKNSYPTANSTEWLIFAKKGHEAIDSVFAGRLAALAKSMGKKIHIISGYRSTAEQERLYKQSKPGYAARPGTSWHEFRLAIDTSDLWLKAIDKDAATNMQATLIKFGLFKPLTKGNGKSVLEDWHIQPIETLGQTDKKAWRPIEVKEEVKVNIDKPNKEVEFNCAIQTLVEHGKMSSPSYWLENAQEGKTVKGEYARELIIRFANVLKG